MTRRLPLIHPGRILQEEFLEELGISQYRLAVDTRMPRTRISQIIKGERSITAETALRLARYFDTTPEFWVNLQTTYDLRVAGRRSQKAVNSEVEPLKHTG